MFEVVMFACNVMGACIQIEDQRGPYLTLEACETRRKELVSVLQENPPWHVPFQVGSKCDKGGVGA